MTFKNRLQKWFIDFISHSLFNTITEEDIYQILKAGEKKIIIAKGKRLDDEMVDKLEEQAKSFLESSLWKKILKTDIQQEFNYRMFRGGNTGDDLLAGKLGLRILEIIEKKLKQIAY